MKKFILYFILSFLPMVTFAQKDTTHSKTTGIIKIYPLQAIVGEIRLGYEKPIAKRLSLELSPGFIFSMIRGEIDGDLGIDGKGGSKKGLGVAARMRLKLYISSNKRWTGFYISPLILYKYFYATTNYNNYPPLTQDIKMYGAQMLFGYTFQRNKFTFELYSGFGFKYVSYNYDFNDMTPISYYTSQYLTLQLGFALGYTIKSRD